jgi:hypothetical protein
MTNNEILKKLRVALSLRDDDIVDILNLVEFKVTKGSLGDLFRAEDHPNFVEAGDQILRNFLNGLVIHMRGPEPTKGLVKLSPSSEDKPKSIVDKPFRDRSDRDAKPFQERSLSRDSKPFQGRPSRDSKPFVSKSYPERSSRDSKPFLKHDKYFNPKAELNIIPKIEQKKEAKKREEFNSKNDQGESNGYIRKDKDNRFNKDSFNKGKR